MAQSCEIKNGTAEDGRLKFSILNSVGTVGVMVQRRIAELKTKAAEDEEFVRLTASLLARRDGTAAESAAREVGKIAGSVEAWTRAMAQQEQEEEHEHEHEHEQEADA